MDTCHTPKNIWERSQDQTFFSIIENGDSFLIQVMDLHFVCAVIIHFRCSFDFFMVLLSSRFSF